jgi:YHS domain-containing protein
MLFRAVIFLILIFLLYKVLKSFQVNRLAKDKEEGSASPRIVGEDLVEDPVCHRHIPVSQAYRKDIAGKPHYFCGKDCLEKYTSTNQS